MSRQIYEEQVELMLRVLPIVAKSEFFALKGGTAINFFVQNMPRLSVDIDLTYAPIDTRSEALNNINNELIKICNGIKSTFNELTTEISKSNDGSIIKRVFISNDIARIKIDPNFILRGTVEPCTTRPLSMCYAIS